MPLLVLLQSVPLPKLFDVRSILLGIGVADFPLEIDAGLHTVDGLPKISESFVR